MTSLRRPILVVVALGALHCGASKDEGPAVVLAPPDAGADADAAAAVPCSVDAGTAPAQTNTAAPRFTGCVTTCDQGLKSVWTFATCNGGVLTCPAGSRPAASCPAGSWDGGADAACGPHVTLDCIVACDGTFWTCIASPFP